MISALGLKQLTFKLAVPISDRPLLFWGLDAMISFSFLQHKTFFMQDFQSTLVYVGYMICFKL